MSFFLLQPSNSLPSSFKREKRIHVGYLCTHHIPEINQEFPPWSLPHLDTSRRIVVRIMETIQRTCPSIEPWKEHMGETVLPIQVAMHPCRDGHRKIPENSLGMLSVRCLLVRVTIVDVKIQAQRAKVGIGIEWMLFGEAKGGDDKLTSSSVAIPPS